MIRIKWFLGGVLLLFLPFLGKAGGELRPGGAQMASLGDAFGGVRGNFWSIFHNPAGIYGLEKPTAGLFYEKRFLATNMNHAGMGFALPFGDIHAAGLDISSFGAKNYLDSKIGLTYAIAPIPKLSLGFKFNFGHLTIPTYGSSFSYSGDIGLNGEITPNLHLGFGAGNITLSKFGDEFGEKIPTHLFLGLAWNTSEKILVVSELRKDLSHPLSFRAGIEYNIIPILYLRAGVGTQPVQANFGVGLDLKGIKIDISNGLHERLGYTPQFSINYSFGK